MVARPSPLHGYLCISLKSADLSSKSGRGLGCSSQAGRSGSCCVVILVTVLDIANGVCGALCRMPNALLSQLERAACFCSTFVSFRKTVKVSPGRPQTSHGEAADVKKQNGNKKMAT